MRDAQTKARREDFVLDIIGYRMGVRVRLQVGSERGSLCYARCGSEY